MNKLNIWTAFDMERRRQDRLKAEGRFKYTAADPELTHADRFIILGEEIGEVAGAIVQGGGLSTDRTDADLKKELIQVGAVITAWLEAID